MRFYFARSSRRHKIGKAHTMAALAHDYTEIDSTYHWVAPDDRGIELHIMGRPAMEDPDLVIIFHIQPTDQRKPS